MEKNSMVELQPILRFAQFKVGEWQLREHAFKRAALLELVPIVAGVVSEASCQGEALTLVHLGHIHLDTSAPRR